VAREEALEVAIGGALFLGVLQGLTEFLPVSSSGHLVLFQQFIDTGGDDVLFALVLHVGTLLPVLWFYRVDVLQILSDPFVGEGPWLQREGVRLAALVGLASVPTAVIGLLFEDLFEAWFATPAVLTITFAITGTLLFISRRFNSGEIGLASMTIAQALIIGTAQGLAITPGISRSGATIVVALMLGMNRAFAARFSFLLSVPAITGAVLLKLDEGNLSTMDPVQLGVGFVASLITGYAALVLLVSIVKRGGLPRFAWYCWGAAIAAGAVALLT
jgi:undecaprenyl-diphosphatase